MRPEHEREYGDFVAARAAGLVRFGFLLCGDWHRAEDAVQGALTKLYLAWPRLARRDAMDGYVRRIVLRVLIDERRLARFRRELLSDRVPEKPVVADPVEATGERMAVLAALAQVPPGQRAVLVLRFWEDLSIDETAEALGCSTGTVKSQAARGLATLRELLGTAVGARTGGSDRGDDDARVA
jgi:RNA polymerase sigma-70 factor (sigma-E family)